MSYPESDREPTKDDAGGEGFPVKPDFDVDPDYRHESGANVSDPTTVPVAGSGFGSSTESAKSEEATAMAGSGSRTTALALPPPPETSGPSAAELNNAFDDPTHGEPGRDRLAIHVVLEILLLILVAGMTIAVNQKHHLDGHGIRGLLVLTTVYGLVALGAGLSLRAGAVNLAVGPIMIASALYFGQQRAHHGTFAAVGLALALAAGIGLAMALVVSIIQAPGWAVSLAAFMGVDVWITHLPSSVHVTGTPNVVGQGYYVFAGFAVIAVVGGWLGTIRPIRRALGRYRPVSDPADRRGAGAALTVGVALVVSSVLASGAGIVSVMSTRTMATDSGLVWSAAAVAIALVAGTSVFGRRGGVAGTLLAAALFVLVTDYSNLADYRVDTRALIGGALAVGVIISRAVEMFGCPAGAHDNVSTAGWLAGRGSRWRTSTTEPVSENGTDRPSAEWV